MKVVVTLTKDEVIEIVQAYLEKKYPQSNVSLPTASVFGTGDRFDRHTGYSFTVSASLTEKEMAEYLK